MLRGAKLRGFQFAPESTAGTLIPANKLMKNGTFKNKRTPNKKRVEAEGHRHAIGQQKGKRWSEWSISGQLGYSFLSYIGAGLFGPVSPTNPATGAYTYSYVEANATLNTPQTFSFEWGNSLGSNSKMAFGVMTDFDLKVSPTDASYTLNGFGAYPIKNITMTANPTIISPVICAISDFKINFAISYANLATGKLLTAKAIDMGVKGKYMYELFIDDATNSIGGVVEKVPDCSGKITVALGSESDYFLANLESDSLIYMQLVGTGPILYNAGGVGNVYSQVIYTWAAYVENEDEGDTEELATGTYDFYCGEDVANNDMSLVVTNYLSGY